MNREILFRGKRKDSGEWVFGCYYKQSEFYGDEVDDHIIITSHEDLSYDQALEYCDVQPETVGQFTGLTDRNGKKIFEGDIVQFYGTYNLEIFVENGHTKIRWFDTVTNSKCKDMFFGYDEELGDCEIIGNIHDNPELLKGGV